jgi:hypothetical protein
MNKQLYLQSTVKKYINLVDLEKKKEDINNLELSHDQIQEMVEIETQKLTELLSLYEKNQHDKDLQLEFISPVKVKELELNVMNEIIQEIIDNLPIETSLKDNVNDVNEMNEMNEINEINEIKDRLKNKMKKKVKKNFTNKN